MKLIGTTARKSITAKADELLELAKANTMTL